MLKPLHLATILLLVFISTTRSVAICYRADTHEAQSSAFTPCNGQRQHSMCYRAQTTLWEGVPDWQRYPNGITVDGTGNCWRQGCTDRTWASPFCLSAFSGCPNVSSPSDERKHGRLLMIYKDYHRNARLTPCSDYASNATRWCCGHDNTTCCERDAIVIPVVLGYSSSTPLPTTAGPSSSLESMNTTTSGISAATLKITVTVTSPTASASASVTPSASADAGLSKGAKSGIGESKIPCI